MDNVPNVLVTDNKSSRENTANQNIAQNRMVQSDDFIIRQTAHGTHIQLKNKHKHNDNYLTYTGDWDASKGYCVNDVARVADGWDYMDNTDTVVSASVGTWVCVYSVPDQYYSDAIIATIGAGDLSGSYLQYARSASVNYYPILPEPDTTASLDNPNGRYWEQIGAGGGASGSVMPVWL